MRYFILPCNISTIEKHNIVIDTNNDNNTICYSLVENLKNNKNKINNHITEWEKCKKEERNKCQ